jgi:hypothetical protein
VLAECRLQLREALAAPLPDSASVLELAVQERLLAARERALAVRLEGTLAGLLQPQQALRLRALPPAAVGDLLLRLCS